MSFKAPAAPPPMKPMRPQPGPERDLTAPQPKPKPRKPGQMHIAFKLLISLLIIWHLAAVFLAPLSIPPSSPLVVDAAQQPPMQWYLDALYINHGYHFFAPEPSNGHLIRYEVMDDRNQIIDQGEFPSKKDNWPRLLYHRYFMLADQCQVDAASDAEMKQWQEEFLKGYARQILREHSGAATVRVRRVVHYPLRVTDAQQIENSEAMQQYRDNPLAYPPTYQVETEVTQLRQDIATEAPAPASGAMINQNWRQDVASGWQGGVR